MATGHVYIYGEIGKEVTVESVRSQLQKNASDYVVHISSPGGDVFAGYTIFNLLKNVGKEIEVRIEGICASIATLIAAAGNKVIMNKTAQFMIHNPQVNGLSGDEHTLHAVAAQLNKIKSILIAVYEPKVSLSREQLWAMYDKETWLTAEEAESLGFVDDVQESLKAVAFADISNFQQMDNKEKDQNSLITRINNGFRAITALLRFKNQVTETLADGTVIMVMAEDGDADWAGKQVIREDGSPLEPGEYPLASGAVIIVGEGSVITEKRMPSVDDSANKDDQNDEEMNNKLLAAEAKIKELQSALEARNAAATEAENRAKSIEARYAGLETQFTALAAQVKEFKELSIGDPGKPDPGLKKEFLNQTPRENGYAPLADFYKKAVGNKLGN